MKIAARNLAHLSGSYWSFENSKDTRNKKGEGQARRSVVARCAVLGKGEDVAGKLTRGGKPRPKRRKRTPSVLEQVAA